MGDAAGAADPLLVTHGICEECYGSLETSLPRSLREYLDEFEAPILCMDGGGMVLAVNKGMARLLGRGLKPVVGLMCGEVMECRHSHLPEGCGRTEHCLACGIRRSLDMTLRTGQGVEHARAYVERDGEDGKVTRVRLLLSTESREGVILLRIDELGQTGRPKQVPL